MESFIERSGCNDRPDHDTSFGRNGTDLQKEQENVIVLIRKTQSKQLTKKVTGTVVDANGEPIIGASIVIKGESHGTITDFMVSSHCPTYRRKQS